MYPVSLLPGCRDRVDYRTNDAKTSNKAFCEGEIWSLGVFLQNDIPKWDNFEVHTVISWLVKIIGNVCKLAVNSLLKFKLFASKSEKKVFWNLELCVSKKWKKWVNYELWVSKKWKKVEKKVLEFRIVCQQKVKKSGGKVLEFRIVSEQSTILSKQSPITWSKCWTDLTSEIAKSRDVKLETLQIVLSEMNRDGYG